MRKKKKNSGIISKTKPIIALVAVPMLLIYVFVAKPNFSFIDTVGGIITPAIDVLGNIVTWPVRAVGQVAENIRERNLIDDENVILKEQLLIYQTKQNEYDVAISENKLLKKQLGVAEQLPFKYIHANISVDNTSFHSSSFFINRGEKDGVNVNMIVLSMDERLVGIVSNVMPNYSIVRGLNDLESKIPVRFTGTEVFGFLTGMGTSNPGIEFLSDQEFQIMVGSNISTKSIHGSLPNGINIGSIKKDNLVDVITPDEISDVLVIKFNDEDLYK